MNITHHPDEPLLLDYVSRRLDAGRSLLLATHIDGCAHCLGRVATLEAIGGLLVDGIEPVSPGQQVLARTLGEVASDAPPEPVREPSGVLPILPGNVPWPRPLRRCNATPWRWLGPGMYWSRVRLAEDPSANVMLLRIGAGKKLPVHTHSDCELTQVLCGSFHDGRARFGPGDFDEADTAILHQPVVDAGSECVCLASISGKVVFDGFFSRAIGSMIGM